MTGDAALSGDAMVMADLCAKLAKAEAERDAAVNALLEANDMCRSAYAIADREFGGRSVSTNWQAFRDRLMESLDRQHIVLTPIRAARREDRADKAEAELAAARKDAARWNAFVELWHASTELTVVQDEDGRWSITIIEAVEAIPTPGKWTGDTPDAAIDAAREPKP